VKIRYTKKSLKLTVKIRDFGENDPTFKILATLRTSLASQPQKVGFGMFCRETPYILYNYLKPT
jgi:hypothetical protein